MPVARTKSGTLLLQSNNHAPTEAHKRKRPLIQDTSVIELSSDDDSLPTTNNGFLSKRKATTPAHIGSHIVLDISDDETISNQASGSSDPKATILSLKKQKRRLREENDRLKKQLYGMRKDCDDAKMELKVAKRELSENVVKLSKASNMNLDSLEEELICEICSLKMWFPYLLPDCGHVFCKDCLSNWFDTTRKQHMQNHSTYAPLPRNLLHALHNPLGDPPAFLHASMFLAQHPPPLYTCPTCREPVTRKPVEDFALKKVVSWLGNVQGDEAPENKHAEGVGNASWDIFFP